MSVRRKAIVALAALAVIVGAWWLWPRDVYRYQGKTAEWWFKEVDWTPPNVDPVTGLPVAAVDDPAREAFRKMETNTAPFLANRITRNRDSLLERWTSRLHDMIKAHTVILYNSSSSVDTVAALEELDQDPANTNNVWLVLENVSARIPTGNIWRF